MPANDDIYVNDGESYNTAYYPEVPTEQAEAEAQQKALIATAYPIMDDIADWFADSIASCDNMHNIEMKQITINGAKYTRNASIEGQVLAYQMLKDLLQEKATEFAEFGKDHK